MTPARPGAGPRWRLWHLAALVLVSALAFGAIRAVSFEANRLRGDLIGLLGLVIAVAVPLAFHGGPAS